MFFITNMFYTEILITDGIITVHVQYAHGQRCLFLELLVGREHEIN